jgi:hypothetical protein
MRSLLLLLVLLGACKMEAIEELGPPALGARIYDRVGRAAVNTALIGIAMPRGEKDALQDRYNAAPVEAWGAFASEIAANLAIYDALDGACGNQLLAGASAAPGRYDALAGVLADDRIYVNAAVGTCEQYFAVELGIGSDCGGRTPAYDVIDVTYSALAIGAVSGVPDGVDADREPPPSEFPFFAP